MKTFFVITLILISAACQAQVTGDTTILSDRDSTYTIWLLYHAPDSIGSNHLIEFGYERLGMGWVARTTAADSNDPGLPVFIYMEDPKYRYDVNRDGRVNIGDLVFLVIHIFGGSE